MNQPSFLQGVERGFAQGVGTLVAYGVALLALTYLVKPQPAVTNASGTGATSTATSCPAAYA